MIICICSENGIVLMHQHWVLFCNVQGIFISNILDLGIIVFDSSYVEQK